MGSVAYADITVQGTNVSSKTDIDGNFSINANIGDTLVISLPGYRTTKAVVNSDPVKATLNYNLKTVTVNEDNTPTFKYAAPKAKLVQVCGNFFQLENGTFGGDRKNGKRTIKDFGHVYHSPGKKRTLSL